MKHLYWFAFYSSDAPSVRYRALYPLQYFRQRHNVSYHLIVPGYRPARLWQFVRSYLSALLLRKPNSYIVIQRVRSNFIYARMLKLLVRLRPANTVFDLDDADYLEHNPSTLYWFVRHCAFVTAGSHALALHLQTMNPRVNIVPSPVPLANCRKQGQNSTFTIGWVGGFHWQHREAMFEQAFAAIVRLRMPVHLVLLGVVWPNDRAEVAQYFEPYPNIELEMPASIDWHNEAALQHTIARFDVGLAPLGSSPYHQAKSGIKAKLYLNQGVPVVSTNTGENSRVVAHNINGFLCNDVDDFYAALQELATMDAHRYQQFSENACASTPQFDLEHYFQCYRQLESATPTKEVAGASSQQCCSQSRGQLSNSQPIQLRVK